MNVPTRLGLYGAALVLVFGASYVAADAFVPESVVTDWQQQAEQNSHASAAATNMPGTNPADASGANTQSAANQGTDRQSN